MTKMMYSVSRNGFAHWGKKNHNPIKEYGILPTANGLLFNLANNKYIGRLNVMTPR